MHSQYSHYKTSSFDIGANENLYLNAFYAPRKYSVSLCQGLEIVIKYHSNDEKQSKPVFTTHYRFQGCGGKKVVSYLNYCDKDFYPKNLTFNRSTLPFSLIRSTFQLSLNLKTEFSHFVIVYKLLNDSSNFTAKPQLFEPERSTFQKYRSLKREMHFRKTFLKEHLSILESDCNFSPVN